MIAIFYDVENLKNFKNYSSAIYSIEKRYEYSKCIQYAYAEWSRFSNLERDLFVKNGINLKQVINGVGYSGNIRNIADISLAVDSIELLFKNANIERFVIVSGDGGYISLINKLKEYGKFVDVVAIKKHTNNALKAYCDNIYYIDSEDDTPGEENTEQDDNLPTVENTEHVKINSNIETSMYQKSIWAILKSYDKHSEIVKCIFKNKHIKENILKNGLRIAELNKTYMIAKKTGIKNGKDFSLSIKNYVQNSKTMTLKNGYIQSTSSKKTSVPAKVPAKVPRKIRKKIPLERKKVIEYFKDSGINISISNITKELIEEVIKKKDLYLQDNMHEFSTLLQRNTKRSKKFTDGIVEIFSIVGAEKVNSQNYQNIISSTLSLHISTKFKHPISRDQIKIFFQWSL